MFWPSIYEAGHWEPYTCELIDSILHPGDLFVDIGAWIGPATLRALKRGASVIAVEPDPVALPELKRRIPESVEVWEGAVGLRRGTAFLSTDDGITFGKGVSRLDARGRAEVPTWTLMEILDGRAPTLVKIDIEGYEIDLLPTIAPHLAELGASMLVSLHGAFPDSEGFDGYSKVTPVIGGSRGVVLVEP